MLKLNLPQNILDKEQYSALSSLQKGEYINNLLRQILELNPNGLTISQVDKALHLGHSTVWHHLESLADQAYCLKMERGDTAVYNFNKIISTLEDCDCQGKFHFFDFDIIENIFGKFVRIQIKQENNSGNLVVNSGIIISTQFFGEFVNSVLKIRDVHLNRDKNKEFFGEVVNPSKVKDNHLNEDKD